MAKKVFVSYSHADQDFVVPLVEDLIAHGVDAWLDVKDIPAGVNWDDEVEAALDGCEFFLIILSPNSAGSQNVKDEIGFARGENKKIFSVMYQKCKVPLRLRRNQYIDFREDNQQALRKLLEELRDAGLENVKVPSGDSVYLSYSRKDLQIALRVGKYLEEEGIRVHSDMEMNPGNPNWRQAIFDIVKKSSAVLVFVSPDGVASKWVLEEVEVALEEGHLVIPVLVQPTTLPLRLLNLKSIDLTVGEFDHGLGQLVEMIYMEGERK